MPRRSQPIRRTLITALLLTSGAAMLTTALAFFAYDFLTYRQSTLRNLGTLGAAIAANSTAALAFDNADYAREVLQKANGWWGVPIQNTARILDVGLLGRLRVFQFERGPAAWVHVGVGYEHIQFRDDQSLPNDVDVELGPLLNAGLELRL